MAEYENRDTFFAHFFIYGRSSKVSNTSCLPKKAYTKRVD